MKRSSIRASLVALVACAAATPLLAQVPVPNNAPPPSTQQMAPPPPPPKAASFQVSGALTIPAFSYADYLDDFGWQAQGALVVRRGAFNHVRLEGEYNSTASEFSGESGAEVYGGGIGGGRVVMKGNVQSEGYGVLGLYEHKITTCTGLNQACADYSELQFGLKVGFDAVLGRGRVRPVIDFHWLTTFSTPYVNLFTIGAGLRF